MKCFDGLAKKKKKNCCRNGDGYLRALLFIAHKIIIENPTQFPPLDRCWRLTVIFLTFKLYGEVNSVKNTTINIWLNDGVY